MAAPAPYQQPARQVQRPPSLSASQIARVVTRVFRARYAAPVAGRSCNVVLENQVGGFQEHGIRQACLAIDPKPQARLDYTQPQASRVGPATDFDRPLEEPWL